jgi:3-dehydroquinate dehydratase/shikimate dehydrogenase
MDTNQVRICVPVCARTVADIEQASVPAAQAGDIVEIRLDCLGEPSSIEMVHIASVIRKTGRPVIITFRAAAQGGHSAATFAERQQFWNTAIALFSEERLDVELDVAQTLFDSASTSLDWTRIICSHHDFAGVPTDLGRIYERMASTPSGILKIAVRANDITDCLPVFQLLARARSEGRKLIAIAMGPGGIATRILGPSLGSYLTYGAMDSESTTAPGQVTAKDLREVYRVDRINDRTQVTGLVGLPVGHSISPPVHNAAFAASGIDAVYIPFEVRDVKSFLERMVHPRTRELDWNLRGLSVTAPHKTTVIDCLDWIDPTAKEIGAVNTIVIEGNELRGYNTDAMAALKPVSEKLGPLRDARCAIIGAGGAASAVLWSLKSEGTHATVFARDQEKGSALAQKFGAGSARLEAASFKEFDFVINTTPLGTRGPLESETPASSVQLRGARLAYDLVYNPSETRFLQQARAAGCDTIGGLTMLVLQAAEQFKLWTGTDAPVAVMVAAAERAASGFQISDLGFQI